jgi:hypothetical protein
MRSGRCRRAEQVLPRSSANGAANPDRIILGCPVSCGENPAECTVYRVDRFAQSPSDSYHAMFIDVCPRKLESRLCQNFYEAACQVTGPVREIDIALDTLAVSARRRSTNDRYRRERVQRPDIVKRLSLARRGGSPFYARSVLKALCCAGA